MAPDPTGTQRQSSNAVARERDEWLRWLLQSHPATAGMLAEIGWFPSRKKASRRLQRLTQRGQVRLLGTVYLKPGRPEHVYCRGQWKGDNVLHEVQLSRLCFRIHADEVRRGPGETDSELRPDAEAWIGGRRFLIELDCDTKAYPAVVRTRLTKYRFCRDFVLWVAPSLARMEGLRRHAALLRETALFTTLDLALADPHAPVWLDVDGGRTALPRGGTNGNDKAGNLPGDNRRDKGGSLSPPGCGHPTIPAGGDDDQTGDQTIDAADASGIGIAA